VLDDTIWSIKGESVWVVSEQTGSRKESAKGLLKEANLYLKHLIIMKFTAGAFSIEICTVD
jgi:N-acetylmuramic acid 6-phosphate (MurNAc-6-P) etherase